LIKRFASLLGLSDPKLKQYKKNIGHIIGRKPGNIDLYFLALRHTSSSIENTVGVRENNERLEYLGDAILGAVVAEYLFKKYPYKDEGFLTEIRSRIVNRESLNGLSRKIGLDRLVDFDSGRGANAFKSVYGDALEALVGAVYLDFGFKETKHFILKKLITPHFDLEEIVSTDTNYKSRLIEWAQRENKQLVFKVMGESGSGNHRSFSSQVLLSNESISIGQGLNKKKAEQDAAQKALAHLGIL
jgi:ribonuclease III